MTIRILHVASDRDRQMVNQYLRELIDDNSEAPMRSVAWERDSGFHSLVLAAYDGDDLIGGLWAGDPYTEFLLQPQVGAGLGPKKVADNARAFLTLHHIAVVPGREREGHGRTLMEELLKYARHRQKQAIYGVSGPTTLGFYSRCGYSVSARNDAILLRFGKDVLAWPIVGESVWFARSLVRGSTFKAAPLPFQFAPWPPR